MADEVCPDCGKSYMQNYRDAGNCDRIRVSSYCANNTIIRLQHQLKAAEAGLHRAWVPCAERMPKTDEPVYYYCSKQIVSGRAGQRGYFHPECGGGDHPSFVTHWMARFIPPAPEPPEVNHVDY